MTHAVDTSRKVILTDKLKHYVDLNTDFGQSQDTAFFEKDGEELLQYVSSVNIPAGVHDSNPVQIKELIAKAKSFHCAIGAHIAYPDPVNFGYQPAPLTDNELAAWIQVQMGAFQALMKTQRLEIEHVRPHGALYGLFLNDYDKAKVVAQTLYEMDRWTLLIAPIGEIATRLSAEVGIQIAQEAHVGRRYDNQGHPVQANFHEQISLPAIRDQVKYLVQDNLLTSSNGKKHEVSFKTLHISPKLDNCIEIAKWIYQFLGQPVSVPVSTGMASGWL